MRAPCLSKVTPSVETNLARFSHKRHRYAVGLANCWKTDYTGTQRRKLLWMAAPEARRCGLHFYSPFVENFGPCALIKSAIIVWRCFGLLVVLKISRHYPNLTIIKKDSTTVRSGTRGCTECQRINERQHYTAFHYSIYYELRLRNDSPSYRISCASGRLRICTNFTVGAVRTFSHKL